MQHILNERSSTQHGAKRTNAILTFRFATHLLNVVDIGQKRETHYIPWTGQTAECTTFPFPFSIHFDALNCITCNSFWATGSYNSSVFVHYIPLYDFHHASTASISAHGYMLSLSCHRRRRRRRSCVHFLRFFFSSHFTICLHCVRRSRLFQSTKMHFLLLIAYTLIQKKREYFLCSCSPPNRQCLVRFSTCTIFSMQTINAGRFTAQLWCGCGCGSAAAVVQNIAVAHAKHTQHNLLSVHCTHTPESRD